MSNFNNVSATPLTWPDGWKRTTRPQRSRFGGRGFVSTRQAIDEVLHQLGLMGVPDWNVIISTNLALRNDGLPRSGQKEPDDSGASVWWRKNDNRQVIALDKYDRVADNLWAIAKTLDAMRGIERWGSGEILERTFTGFAALPPATEHSERWQDILQLGNVYTIEECERNYRKLARDAHPDRGGSHELMQKLNWAREQARFELGGGT